MKNFSFKNDFQHDLSTNSNFFNEFLTDIENYLNKNFTDKDKLEVTRFLFGRSTASESKANLFERILSTKGTKKLIELIWDKIDLASREEILNLVSNIVLSAYRVSSYRRFLIRVIILITFVTIFFIPFSTEKSFWRSSA